MEVQEAQQVLTLLGQIQDVQRSWKDQMPDLAERLVPALRGESLYQADSLVGFAVKWFRGYETKKTRIKKIEKVFWKALHTSSPAHIEGLSQQRKIQLLQHLRQTHTQTEKEVRKNAYQKELELDVANETDKSVREIKQQSLLNPLRKKRAVREYDPELLNEIFGVAPRSEKYDQFLQQEINTTIEDERLLSSRNAAAYEEKLREAFFPNGARLADDQRCALYAVESKRLEDTARNLEVGKSFLFSGSYGQKIRSVKEIFELAEKLPPLLKHLVPKHIASYLEKGASIDPEEIAAVKLKEIFSEVTAKLPEFNRERLSFLFSNDTRDLPESIKQLMPQLLSDAIQKNLARGLFGNAIDAGEAILPSPEVNEVLGFIFQVMREMQVEHPGLSWILNMLTSFIPSRELLPVLTWVHENLADFFDNSKKEQAEKKLQEYIIKQAGRPFNQFLDTFLLHFEGIRNRIKNSVPGVLMQGSSLEGLFINGSIWFEIEKQSDGKFTVKVFGDDYASSIFCKRGARDNWPIVIRDVSQDNLDAEFFHVLLYHHFEPSYSSKFRSTVDALYQSLVSLEGSWERGSSRQVPIGSGQNGLVNAVLLEKPGNNGKIFDCKVDAFVSFAHGLMKKGEIRVDEEPKKRLLLLKMADVIQVEMEQASHLSKEKMTAIEATIQEVRLFCILPRADVEETTRDPALLAQPIAEILGKAGISKDMIRNNGDVLNVILGPELMNVVDLIIDSVDAPPEAVPSVQTPIVQLASLGQNVFANKEVSSTEKITTLQSIVRNIYFQMVFKFVRNTYIAYHLLRSPLYLLSLATPQLTDFIPQQYLNYILETIALIKKLLTQIFTYAVMRIFFNSKTSLSLKHMQDQLNAWAKSTLNVPVVSYEVTQINHSSDHMIILGTDSTHFPKVVIQPSITRRSYSLNDVAIDLSSSASIANVIRELKRKYCKLNLVDESDALVREYCWYGDDIDIGEFDITERVFFSAFSVNADLSFYKGDTRLGKTFRDAIRRMQNPKYALRIVKILLDSKAYWHEHLTESCLVIDSKMIKIPSLKIEIDFSGHIFFEAGKDGWRGTLTNVNLEAFLVTLLKAIYDLPLPRSANCVWQQIDNPEECLESLSKIGALLKNNSIRTLTETKKRLASFHLLAIMESLALRVKDSKLDGYRVNGAALKLWKQSSLCVLEEMDDVDELERLVDHYSYSKPGHTDTELFHYAYSSNYGSNARISPADYRYLENIYRTIPGIDERISTILNNTNRNSFFADSDPNLQEWKDCLPEDNDIISVLNAMSNTLNDQESVIPRAYRLLKFQAHICSYNFIKGDDNFQLWTNTMKDFRWLGQKRSWYTGPVRAVKWTYNNLLPLRKDIYRLKQPTPDSKGGVVTINEKQKVFVKPRLKDFVVPVKAKRGIFSKVTQKIREDFEGRIFTGFCGYSSKERYRIIDTSVITQSGIMNQSEFVKEIFRCMDFFSKDDRNMGEFVYVEYSDRIPRVIAFYREDLNRLNCSSMDWQLQNLKAILFQGDFLKEHLKAAPDFARVLGTFVSSLLHLNNKELKSEEVIKLAIALKRYCCRYAPAYCDTFPESISNTTTKNFEKAKTAVLGNDGPPATFTSEMLRALSKMYCIARFAEFDERILINFKKWSPAIKRLLQERAFAEEVAVALLNELGVLYAQKDLEGIIHTQGFAIKIPSLLFSADFESGEIVYRGRPDSGEIPHLKGMLKNDLKKIRLINHPDSQELEHDVDGVTYVALNPRDLNLPLIMEGESDTGYMWVEKELKPARRLLKQFRPHMWAVHPRSLVRRADGRYECSSDPGEARYETNGLLALNRFCAQDDIATTVGSDRRHLATIRINSFELDFNVKCENEEYLALSSIFPEFYIAPQQDVPACRPYGSYLLLENRKGERKILVSTNNPVTPALWHLYKYFQPFSHLLPNRIETGQSSKAHYYTYDMDGAENLQSEDPEALVYLLRINMIHKNMNAVESTMRQFVAIAKRMMIPMQIWNQLTLLTVIPDSFGVSQKVRICLFAAMEENLLIHHVDPSNIEVNDELSFLHRLLLIQALISDLEKLRVMSPLGKKIQGQAAYSLDKEWYLYKCLMRQFGSMLEAQQIASRFVSKEHFEAFLEFVVMPKALAVRYEKLKEHFGIVESLFLRTLRMSKAVVENYRAPTSVYLNLDQIVYAIFNKAFSNQLNQIEEVKKGLIAYFNIENELVHISQTVQQMTGISDGTLLKMRELAEIENYGNDKPLFDLSALTPDLVKARFIYYYAVARGEKTAKEAKALKRMLLLAHNRFDDETNLLMTIIAHQFSHHRIFPGSKELEKAMKSRRQLPDMDDGEVMDLDLKTQESDLVFFEVESATSEADFFCAFWRLYDKAQKSPVEFNALRPKLEAVAAKGDLTRKLVDYFYQVAEAPNEYMPLQWFQVRIRSKKFLNKDIYRNYFDCWGKIQKRYYMAEVGSASLRMGASAMVQAGAASAQMFIRRMISPDFLGGVTLQAGDALNATFSPLTAGRCNLSYRGDEIYRPDETPYKDLDAEDNNVNMRLENWFARLFDAEGSLDSDERRFGGMDKALAKSELERVRIDRINLNVDQFYTHNQNRVKYRLKDIEQLWGIYREVIVAIDQIEAEFKNDEKALLKTVNSSEHVTLNGFDTLVQFALTGDLSLLGNELRLKPDALKKLDFLIVRQLARGVRLKQLKRVRVLIEKTAHLDRGNDRAKYYTHIEGIADELMDRRVYKFDTLRSPRLVLRLLCFEYYSDKLIWPKQYERLTKLLLEKRGNQVVEWIMGLGKTACGIPIIDDFEADGSKIVINIWPRGMVETNVRQIGHQHAHVMKRMTNVLRFDRDHSMDASHLAAMKVQLRSCMDNRESLNMTREDLQALELSLIENLYNYHTGQASKLVDIKSVILSLQGILRMIRQSAHVVGDEAHELYHHVQELNYPVGKCSRIESKYYKIMERCVRFLIEDETVNNAIKTGSKCDIALDLKVKIAGRFHKNPEFIAFVTGQTDVVPPSLAQEGRFDEMAMVKGMLTVLLPNAFSKEALVDHGPSQAGGGEFARPYEGNTRALESSLLRSPYESLTKTFVQFLSSGLNPEQAFRALKMMKILAKEEAIKKKINIKHTNLYRLIMRLCPDADFNNDESFHPYARSLKMNRDLIFFYVEKFVSMEIKYWRLNICSNTQNFGSIFLSQYNLTGTPYNDGTYPDNLEVLWDEGTTGEALHIASNKCPADGVRILEQEAPVKVLEEVLNTYFKSGSDFMALIDGSAILKGMSDMDVAKKIVAFVSEHRKDIQGIVFFRKDAFNRDQLVCWVVGASEPVPLDRTNIPPEARLTYYDHLHGFAADVPQKTNAKAINLVGDRVTLYRLLQEIFRMRGIKVWKKLLEANDDDLSDFKKQTQEVHFAVSRQTALKITPEGVPSFRDIVAFALKNEAQVGVDNYGAHRNKIANEGRRYVLDAILEAKSLGEMYRSFKRYQNLLLTTIEDNPAKLWGMVARTEDTSKVIDTIETNLVNSFDRKEREEIGRRLRGLKKAAMPPKVQIYTNGKDSRYDGDSDIGQTVTVTATQNQNLNQEQQAEQTATTNVLERKKKISVYEELDWDKDLDVYSLEWVRCVNPADLSKASRFPLWNLRELVCHSPFKTVEAAFDSRVWFSNNFLPLKNPKSQMNIHVSSKEQRELIHVLVLGDITPDTHEFKIASLGCISLADAGYWRKRIKAQERPNYKVALIYDVPLDAVTWGQNDVNTEMLHRNKEFQGIIAQLKFLNGDTISFTEIQKDALKEWISVNNAKALAEAAEIIFEERNQIGLVKNSVLDLVFSQFDVDLESGKDSVFE